MEAFREKDIEMKTEVVIHIDAYQKLPVEMSNNNTDANKAIWKNEESINFVVNLPYFGRSNGC